jgi:hypothetical protein
MHDVIAELQPLLTEVVRIGADFDAAYRPVLVTAQKLSSRVRLLRAIFWRRLPGFDENGALLGLGGT